LLYIYFFYKSHSSTLNFKKYFNIEKYLTCDFFLQKVDISYLQFKDHYFIKFDIKIESVLRIDKICNFEVKKRPKHNHKYDKIIV